MKKKAIGFLSLLLLISATIQAQTTNTKQITRAELEDKVAGYWIGQLCGNYFGFPFELVYTDDAVPVDVDKYYTSRNHGSVKINDRDQRGNIDALVSYLGGAPSDDDHDLEYVTLLAVEQFGLDITYEEIRPILTSSVNRMVWVSTEHAVKAMRNGALPPATGAKGTNPYWTDLMASISTEIWGSFYPGMTQEAADGAEWFGRISNDDYAIYLAKFYASMFSAAFFESDMETLISIGLKQIPEDNVLYTGIMDVKKWCAENSDWRATRQKIFDKYYMHDRDFLTAVTDALPNGLMGIMSLIYSGDDFKKNLSMSTSAGLDADNQPATIGGLLGVVHGLSNLPKDYTTIWTNGKEPFYGMYVNTTRDGLPVRIKNSDIVSRICDIAEDAILANGGQKGENAEGETVYTIQTDL